MHQPHRDGRAHGFGSVMLLKLTRSPEDTIRFYGRHATAGEFLVESRHCFGTAVEAARSSEGIFTPVLLLFLFYVEECPVDT